MASGYTGKVLFVDLTTGAIQEEMISEQVYRRFLGGTGLGARVLYERMKARVDPLGPDNMLGFVAGLLTGTPVPGSGRFMVVSKSPLLDGWGEANSGGTFGPELKAAGYDAVFFSGAAAAPVYLLIKDGKAELRDAAKLWGKDTHETEELLHNEIGVPGVKIACIGQAGEKQSLLAGIVNEQGRIAARNGLGAVMGAKRLKAVAVKGCGYKVGVANRDKLKDARQIYDQLMQANPFTNQLKEGGTAGGYKFLVSIGDSPVKNWSLSGLDAFANAENLAGGKMDEWKLNKYACYACPVGCGAMIKQETGPFAVPVPMHRPEYESLAGLGGLLMNDNLLAAMKANDLCNRYGIDTISTGGAIALAMECYEKGLIDSRDTEGIDLKWGNAEAIVALVDKIGRREGFGAVLADGAGKAAERIGKGAEQFAVTVRGKSLPYHDPRMAPALGTAMFADANPAHHMDCKVARMLEAGAPIGKDPALQMPAVPFDAFDQKGPMYALGFAYNQVLNAAGMCALLCGNVAPPPIAELISAVTGWNMGYEEVLQIGRRILTLRQAFNAREGVTPAMFQLPKRIMEEPLTTGPLANKKINFEALKYGYFSAMGWDYESGKPSIQTLDEVGLSELTLDLAL